MFERFTDEARSVIVLAQEAARGLGHNAIDPAHLLLGVLGSPGSLATDLLIERGITPHAVTTELEKLLPRTNESYLGHMPFTPCSKKILELGLRESLLMGVPSIEGFHLLQAICRESENHAVAILKALGFDADVSAVRQVVVSIYSNYDHPKPPEPPARKPPSPDTTMRLALASRKIEAPAGDLIALLNWIDTQGPLTDEAAPMYNALRAVCPRS